MNAKGHFHNSSELPKGESNPSQDSSSFIQEDLGRCFCASSVLSHGLEMYYYANVNFDTEFKKRLLDFFFSFQKKEGGPICGHHCLFCNVNCNYAFCKGRVGERAERGRK